MDRGTPDYPKTRPSGTHFEQRPGCSLRQLPVFGRLRGRRVRLIDVEGSVPIIEREEVAVRLTKRQAARLRIAKQVVFPWRHQPILEVDDVTGEIVDIGADGIALTTVNADAAPPFTYTPLSRRDLELLGFSDDMLERAYRDRTGEGLILEGPDTSRTRTFRRHAFDVMTADWYP